MAERLQAKGFTVAGAAKIAAVHSMMWHAEKPLGQGHPDADDDTQLRQLVTAVCAESSDAVFSAERLDYQPAAVKTAMAPTSVDVVKQMFGPFAALPEQCSQCGVCTTVCPVQAISCSPYPYIQETCCKCFNCVRACPQQAFSVHPSVAEARIRSMAQQYNRATAYGNFQLNPPCSPNT